MGSVDFAGAKFLASGSSYEQKYIPGCDWSSPISLPWKRSFGGKENQTLDQLCLRAGFSPNSWNDKDVDSCIYSAQAFGE